MSGPAAALRDDPETRVARRSAGGEDSRATLDDPRLRRIRWRCRRGMLENDIVLARFLDRHGESLSDGDLASLDALLDLSDNALWDVIAGRSEPAAAHAAFVARLRTS